MAKILAWAGSNRKGSWNQKLLMVAAQAVSQAGGDITVIHLKDYPLPIYDADLEQEQGLPENARKLKTLMKAHDAFLIASPEYNSAITPLLKNTIDWTSRQEGDEPSLACFRGKVAALVSASPGAMGGMRSLLQLRSILMNIGVLVLPTQRALSRAGEAFDDAGKLKDRGEQTAISGLAGELVAVVNKLKG